VDHAELGELTRIDRGKKIGFSISEMVCSDKVSFSIAGMGCGQNIFFSWWALWQRIQISFFTIMTKYIYNYT
jgi:hypothetical protein